MYWLSSNHGDFLQCFFSLWPLLYLRVGDQQPESEGHCLVLCLLFCLVIITNYQTTWSILKKILQPSLYLGVCGQQPESKGHIGRGGVVALEHERVHLLRSNNDICQWKWQWHNSNMNLSNFWDQSIMTSGEDHHKITIWWWSSQRETSSYCIPFSSWWWSPRETVSSWHVKWWS